MSPMIITFLVLLACIAALISNKVPLGIVGIACPAALSVFGVLTTAEAWSGFSNTATITFAALFVLGGVALNGLSLAELEENGLPLSLQEDYLHSLEKIKTAPVDLLALSHPGHYLPEYAALIPQNDGTGKILRVPGAWEKLLDSRIAEIKGLMERDRKQFKE